MPPTNGPVPAWRGPSSPTSRTVLPALRGRWTVRRTLSAAVALTLVAAPLVVGGSAAPAQAAVTTPFQQLFSANTNGDVIIRGNTLMSCVDSASTCAAARAATTSPADKYDNNEYGSQFVDIDGDSSTFNSSSAELTVPAGGSVLYAALLWGARTETSGTPAPDVARKRFAKFKVPGSSTYADVEANRVDELTPGTPGAYQGFVDVTRQVQAAGSGTYTVADVQASRSSDRYAGWSLVVAVSDPSAPARNLTVYSGFATVAGSQVVDIPVEGFLTPPKGPVRTTLGLVAYEGDLGKTGDSLKLNGTKLTNGRNSEDNVFNSSITDRGTDTPGRNPSYNNQLGFDADLISADGILTNGATNATISLTTGGETYYPGVVTFSTDLYDPKLLGTKTVTDVNGGEVVRGDVLEYEVPVENVGLDAADDSVFFDAVPTGTTYVPGSLSVDGTAYTDVSGDDPGTFLTDDNQGHLLVNIGAGATASRGGTIPADGTTEHEVRFRVTVDADAANGQPLTNAAGLTYLGRTTRASSASATNAVVSPVVTDPAAVNRPPSAASRIRTFTPAAASPTLTIDALAGSTDPDSDPLTVVGITDGSGGPVTVGPGGLLSYTPGPAFAGRDVFTFTLFDGHGGTSTATVQVDVVNTAPKAIDDIGSTPYRTSVDLDVVANDTDANGDSLSVRSVPTTSTRGGSLSVQPDGRVRYVPATGVRGTDTFDYVLQDARGGSDTATVTLTVTNTAPVAVADTYATPPGVDRSVAVLTNDSDPDGDPLTAALVSGPSHGTLTLAVDGTGTFKPVAGFLGPDSFTYRASDGFGGVSAVTTVTVTIAATLVAADDSASTDSGDAVDVAVLANDSGSGTLSVTGVTQGSHGSAVVQSDRTVRYTPSPGWAGTDTFTYDVADDNGASTATVTVTTRNASPVAAPDAASTQTGVPAADVDVLGNDSDPNIPGTTQQLHVSAATADQGATVVVNGDDTLTVTPPAAFRGTVSVGYTVTDIAGGTATGTLLVTVDNTAPVATPDGPVRTPTDTAVTVDVLANDADGNNDPLTVVPGSLTPPLDSSGAVQGTVTVVSGLPRYVPSPGFAGTVTFGYEVTDGSATSSSTVTVTVDNAPPVTTSDSARTTSGGSVMVSVLANDTDPNIPGTGQVLSVVAAAGDRGAVVSVRPDQSLVVTSAPGHVGTVTVTYTVSDGAGGSATGVLTVDVTAAPPVPSVPVQPAPEAPRLTAVPDTARTDYLRPVRVDVVANDTGGTGPLRLVPGSLTPPVDAYGTVRGNVDLTGGRVVYTPPAGFSGPVTFGYRVTDGTVTSSAGTVTVTVVNTPPVAVDDSATAVAGQPVTIDVLGNDTDPDGGVLSIVAASQPWHGTVAIVDGTIVYTPDPSITGTDTFTYTVSDGQGGTTVKTVRVDVLGASVEAPAPSAPSIEGAAAGFAPLRPTSSQGVSAGQTLPRTGAESRPLLGAGLGGVLLGATLLLLGRRRRA